MKSDQELPGKHKFFFQTVILILVSATIAGFCLARTIELLKSGDFLLSLVFFLGFILIFSIVASYIINQADGENTNAPKS